eukprot:m.78010 g.78010  ORF g.78010 m.78010 type:complete len:284 (+) comp16209_c0_seq1:248-1099(+)
MHATSIIVAIASLVATTSAASSPVLGWSTDSSAFPDASNIRAGITIPVEDLFSRHIHLPTSGVTVVFIQKELTVDILTKCEASLPVITGAMRSAQSTVFAPSVNAPKGVPAALTRIIDGSASAVPARDFLTQRITISASNNTVLHVSLPNVDKMSCEKQQQNDKLMGEIIEYLEVFGASINVLVVGETKSVATSEKRSRRDAVNEAANNGNTYCTSNACRNARRVGYPVQTVYFSTTILMSIIVVLFLVSILITGVFGLMVLQNNDKFPDASDEHLIISTRNE